jgi:ATP-binding cassette subfamily B protein
MQERTSLVVAHRLSTIQKCDRILVFHHGELRESGTHNELLGARGLYWRLYQLQYSDDKMLPGAPNINLSGLSIDSGTGNP